MEKQSLFTRACDPCRARKIRCDKGSPCSACSTSHINCTRSKIEPTQRKKRIHVSEDINFIPWHPCNHRSRTAQRYAHQATHRDGRLRLIEERLHEVHRLIANTNLREDSQSAVGSTPNGKDSNYSTLPIAQRSRPHDAQDDSDNEQDSDDYEGETSLQAQSVVARKFLEQVVGHTGSPAHASELSKAVKVLQQMSEEKSSSRPRTNEMFVNAGITSRTDLSQLPLPPVDAVLYVLRKSREIPTLTFGATIGTTSLQTVTDLCKSVFFCTDAYPTSTAILVHGNLFYTFHEFSLMEDQGDLRPKFRQYCEMCRVNMEVSLSNLPLLLTASMENIEALLMGSLWSIECANTRRAWKLQSLAIGLAQSLGWHRKASLVNVDEATKTKQLNVFWFLYVLDKGLSLRLGRASNLQDYDIDVPLPPVQHSLVTGKSSSIFRRWIGETRVGSEVYEKLYSPGAQKTPPALKVQLISGFVDELKEIRASYIAKEETASIGEEDINRAPAKRVLQLIDIADDVQHYALLTIIYRVMPAENQGRSSINRECVEAARKAISTHLGCYSFFREADDQVWSFYMHRTLLHAPFAPVLVLFCNVLTSQNLEDLAMIEAFANSIDGDHFSDAAHKLHRMCLIFSQVAKLYVEARKGAAQSYTQRQDQQRLQQQQQQQQQLQGHHQQEQQVSLHQMPMGMSNIPATQPWGPLAPYVDAMNYAGDPMMDWGDMTNMNWTDWLQGNQSVKNILENNSPP